MSDLPKMEEHSPIGASSAERWMNCPGSVSLIKSLKLPPTDEPDYRAQGTAAHEWAAACLMNGQDAWEIVGMAAANGIKVDADMANAIQVYLDECRPVISNATRIENIAIEHRVQARELHPLLYGTADFRAFEGDLLIIKDYKHGQGVAVDAEDNDQLKYYAFCELHDKPWISRVELTIVQPRGFHSLGPIRTWETSADSIREWGEKILLPAMRASEVDGDLLPGSWCRFCPAKLLCPVMHGMFQAAAEAGAGGSPVGVTTDRLSREFGMISAVTMYIKALKDELERRLHEGETCAGAKLVPKIAHRVWKPEAAALARDRFGADAVHPPELKGPADIDKLPGGKAFTKEWAFAPNTGLTLATMDDKRVAVKAEKASSIFAGAAEAQ